MAVEIPNEISKLPTSEVRFVGKAGVKRVEDALLLSGRVEFIDDLSFPGMLHAAILRAPMCHARIVSIDTSAALKLPGVTTIVTGEDAKRWSNPAFSAPEGWGTHVLATDKVRFVGEPVAAVAAISRYVAEDALELIEVEYEDLDPVADVFEAMKEGSALVMEEHGSNIMMQRTFNWGDTDTAFAEAAHTYSEKFRWNRVGANPMETFGCISEWNPVDLKLTVHGSFQSPSNIALGRATTFGLPSNKVRIISQPHGGSFGGKGGTRGTDITAMLSRKADGRPVKWIEDRMEYLTAGAVRPGIATTRPRSRSTPRGS